MFCTQEWFNLARNKLFGWWVPNKQTCSFLHWSCLISWSTDPGRVKDSIGTSGNRFGAQISWEILLYWKTVQWIFPLRTVTIYITVANSLFHTFLYVQLISVSVFTNTEVKCLSTSFCINQLTFHQVLTLRVLLSELSSTYIKLTSCKAFVWTTEIVHKSRYPHTVIRGLHEYFFIN